MQLGYTLPFYHSHCGLRTDYLKRIPDPCHINQCIKTMAESTSQMHEMKHLHRYKLLHSPWKICPQETDTKCKRLFFPMLCSHLFFLPCCHGLTGASNTTTAAVCSLLPPCLPNRGTWTEINTI